MCLYRQRVAAVQQAAEADAAGAGAPLSGAHRTRGGCCSLPSLPTIYETDSAAAVAACYQAAHDSPLTGSQGASALSQQELLLAVIDAQLQRLLALREQRRAATAEQRAGLQCPALAQRKVLQLLYVQQQQLAVEQELLDLLGRA